MGLIFAEFVTCLKSPQIDRAKNKPYYTFPLKALEIAKIGLSENLTHLPSVIFTKISRREKFPMYGNCSEYLIFQQKVPNNCCDYPTFQLKDQNKCSDFLIFQLITRDHQMNFLYQQHQRQKMEWIKTDPVLGHQSSLTWSLSGQGRVTGLRRSSWTGPKSSLGTICSDWGTSSGRAWIFLWLKKW